MLNVSRIDNGNSFSYFSEARLYSFVVNFTIQEVFVKSIFFFLNLYSFGALIKDKFDKRNIWNITQFMLCAVSMFELHSFYSLSRVETITGGKNSFFGFLKMFSLLFSMTYGVTSLLSFAKRRVYRYKYGEKALRLKRLYPELPANLIGSIQMQILASKSVRQDVNDDLVSSDHIKAIGERLPLVKWIEKQKERDFFAKKENTKYCELLLNVLKIAYSFSLVPRGGNCFYVDGRTKDKFSSNEDGFRVENFSVDGKWEDFWGQAIKLFTSKLIKKRDCQNISELMEVVKETLDKDHLYWVKEQLRLHFLHGTNLGPSVEKKMLDCREGRQTFNQFLNEFETNEDLRQSIILEADFNEIKYLEIVAELSNKNICFLSYLLGEENSKIFDNGVGKPVYMMHKSSHPNSQSWAILEEGSPSRVGRLATSLFSWLGGNGKEEEVRKRQRSVSNASENPLSPVSKQLFVDTKQKRNKKEQRIERVKLTHRTGGNISPAKKESFFSKFF